MTQTCAAPRHPSRPAIALRQALMTLFAVRSQRRALLDLTDEALRDIGLTREQAAREADRPFWDVPAGWRR